jgi:hypothetical protein
MSRCGLHADAAPDVEPVSRVSPCTSVGLAISGFRNFRELDLFDLPASRGCG